MYYGHEKTSDNLQKANLFNCFFHSVFSDCGDTLFTNTLSIPANCLSSIDISIQDTWNALVALDTTKAMVCDGIPPIILKYATTALVDPVHHLFNLCLSQSFLPADWRSHLITPIPKSGDKADIKNYRPISLLCSISKVLEKLVFDKISDFLIGSIISTSQFGFVKNRSVVQQLLLYHDFLSQSFDNGVNVDTAYTSTFVKLLILYLMKFFCSSCIKLESLAHCWTSLRHI